MTVSPNPPPAFLAQVEALEIAFDSGDVERLARYLALLLDAARSFNLTAITDPDEAWVRHIADSLTLLPILASLEAKRVIDVGAGGGLPGVPLAIAMPDVSFTLLEATGKKARFLEETAAALDLANVTVVNDRAETAGQDRETHRERYDAVLARAVGRMPVLVELTVPLARIGGHVLAIKGARAEAEVAEAKAALHTLHARVVETRRTATGTIVIIEKSRRTGKMYPRRPGEPKRAPLGRGTS
ncbi:MAG: 16S rRNA (guanine(527)-N(7))-methyltransferase RsmG [Planctomycetes bacterium]|nr:16S rRNA (guanine(527)-N(7))-methyltransferase RsmG [Planctomycetota bacterium]